MNAPRVCKLCKTFLPALTSEQWCYQNSMNRNIYDCKLRNEKENLFQVRNEYSPQTYKLWHTWQLKNKEAL